LFLNSCTEEVSQEDCEILSMKKFKAIPMAANKFDRLCVSREIVYTAELCQLALNDLTMGAPIEVLEKKYGSLISYCFTQNDLEKFTEKKQ